MTLSRVSWRILPGLLLWLGACGVDVSQRLLEAAAAGRAEGVRRYLLEGAPVNTTDARGRTPVMLAAQGGHPEVVAYLLQVQGQDLARTDDEGWTALMYAGAAGHVDTVSLLLAHGAAVNAANKFGNTSLMWAVRGGHTDVVHLLLNHGADARPTNLMGWDARYMARRFGHEDLLPVLDARGDAPPVDRVL